MCDAEVELILLRETSRTRVPAERGAKGTFWEKTQIMGLHSQSDNDMGDNLGAFSWPGIKGQQDGQTGHSNFCNGYEQEPH